MEIFKFSFKKMHLKLSSVKWRLSCLGLNLLITLEYTSCATISTTQGFRVQDIGSYTALLSRHLRDQGSYISNLKSCLPRNLTKQARALLVRIKSRKLRHLGSCWKFPETVSQLDVRSD